MQPAMEEPTDGADARSVRDEGDLLEEEAVRAAAILAEFRDRVDQLVGSSQARPCCD